MPWNTDGSRRLKKVLSTEPQLGLVLFLISVPIVLMLAAFALLTGAFWVQVILNPWRDPVLALVGILYAIWGVIEIRRARRASPGLDSDGYIRRVE